MFETTSFFGASIGNDFSLTNAQNFHFSIRYNLIFFQDNMVKTLRTIGYLKINFKGFAKPHSYF